MTETSGWYVITKSDAGVLKDGPYDTTQIEELIDRGDVNETTLVAHLKYTKGKAVQSQKLHDFFDRHASVSENTALTLASKGLKQRDHELSPVAQNRDEAGIGQFMADG